MMKLHTLAGLLTVLSVFTASTTPRRLLGNSFGAPGNASYEYVVVGAGNAFVVGAGNAGLPLATRLAEGGHTVALIEAGSFYEIGNGNYSQIPVLAPAFVGKDVDNNSPQIDWSFETVPQNGMLGQSQLYPRGKSMGGCTARNFNSFHRGNKGAYKKWADEVGDDSFQWQNILPYFQKSITFTPPPDSRFPNATPKYDVDSLGDAKGPVQVGYGAYAWAFGSWAIKALAEVGIPEIQGFTSGDLLGSTRQLLTIDPVEQTRDSAETSFLRKLGLKNPNLIVYPDTLATRILFDGFKRAVGVSIDFGRYQYTLSATKEVIVSAGVFQSPQLLMVSGIGPQETLEKQNIPAVANRSGVGKNMTDHVYGGPTYRVNMVTSDDFDKPDFVANATEEYNTYPIRGPYASFDSDVLAFEKLPNDSLASLSEHTRQGLASNPNDWPDVEYIILSSKVGRKVTSPGTNPNGHNYGSIELALVAPFSRGSLTIQSNDMHDYPLIDPNWLSDPRDQEVAVAGYKRVREFFQTRAMKSVTIGDEYSPGAKVSSDADILKQIKTDFDTVHHAACTCRMGRRDDPTAVVDSKARVIGVEGLRVVDASSFALLPPGNPMATIYMFAEKIADEMLKGEAQR